MVTLRKWKPGFGYKPKRSLGLKFCSVSWKRNHSRIWMDADREAVAVWRDASGWRPTTWRGTGPVSLRSSKTDIRTVRFTSNAIAPTARTSSRHAALWKLSTPFLHFTGWASSPLLACSFLQCLDAVGWVAAAAHYMCHLYHKFLLKAMDHGSWKVV